MASWMASSCRELQEGDALRRLINKGYKREERATGYLPRNKESPFGDFPRGPRGSSSCVESPHVATASIKPLTRFNERESLARSNVKGR